MNRFLFAKRHAILVCCLLGAAAAAADGEPKQYVCPHCGCAEDTVAVSEPGNCATCAMKLIVKGQTVLPEVPYQRPATRPSVAILLFEGVQIIDYTGPYETLGQAGFRVFTVAGSKEPLTTAMGMKVVPHHTLDDHPKADILLLPGGGVESALNDDATLAWVARTADTAEHVLTVCNGAFILAKTGKLDGLEATTYYGLIDSLQSLAPKCKVVTDKRFVDNGKIVTTAGLSSGIDGALHIIGKIHGEAAAQRVALNMEYQWRPGDAYARADFADRALVGGFLSNHFYPRMELPESEWRLLYTWGDKREWCLRWNVTWSGEAVQLQQHLTTTLAEQHGWQRIAAGADSGTSNWVFEGNGKTWRADLAVAPKTQGAMQVTLTINQRVSGDGH